MSIDAIKELIRKGDIPQARERAFANRDAYWHGVTAALGFPLGMIEAEGLANFALLIRNCHERED